MYATLSFGKIFFFFFHFVEMLSDGIGYHRIPKPNCGFSDQALLETILSLYGIQAGYKW